MSCCTWRICYLGVRTHDYALDDGDFVAEVERLGLQLLLLPLLFASLPLQSLCLFAELAVLCCERFLLLRQLTGPFGDRSEFFLFLRHSTGHCALERITLPTLQTLPFYRLE